MAWVVLFGENARRTEPFLRRDEDWVVVGLLVGTMLAGALAFWLAERWRKKSAARADVAGELTDYRGMYERGEITEAEYARLPPELADLANLPDDDEDDPPGGADPRRPGPDPPPPGPGGPPNPPPPA